MSTSNSSNGAVVVIKKIFDFIGVVIPCITFLFIFVSFMTQILSRYFFNIGVAWSNEVSILGYMWTMFFGCGKAIENDEHVVFSLVYDIMNPTMQRVCRIVYNLALVILLIIVFKPCMVNLLAAKGQSAALKIPYKICFAPFMYMLAEVIVRSAINVWKAITEKGGKAA